MIGFDTDGVSTLSSLAQQATEFSVINEFRRYIQDKTQDAQCFQADRLDMFLSPAIDQIPSSFGALDCSRPWLPFWILHALDLLNRSPENPEVLAPSILEYQSPLGGFCGSKGSLPHLAPTYAAVAALVTLGQGLDQVNRPQMYQFLMESKVMKAGQLQGFRVHEDGEIDIRGAYLATATASMLGLLTDEFEQGIAQYLAGCQTYEGGFAGVPGLEAHGGYSYCALATLCLLGDTQKVDLHSLLNWAVHRQLPMEGGFQGRTNKLVDSCYTFWVGALFPLIQLAFSQQGIEADFDFKDCVNVDMCALYVVMACQDQNEGGLRDKPEKYCDFYHTCYALSGLSALSHGSQPSTNHFPQAKMCPSDLQATDLLYNVCQHRIQPWRTLLKGAPLLGREGAGIQGLYGPV